eukprot:EG_transcript_38564
MCFVFIFHKELSKDFRGQNPCFPKIGENAVVGGGGSTPHQTFPFCPAPPMCLSGDSWQAGSPVGYFFSAPVSVSSAAPRGGFAFVPEPFQPSSWQFGTPSECRSGAFEPAAFDPTTQSQRAHQSVPHSSPWTLWAGWG